jgi:Xanthosine triphosphate pyrophosphatase
MEKAIDKILLASNNLHKLNEINSFFEGKIKFILPKDIGIYQDYEENGLDFEENAILKVKEISEKIDIPVLPMIRDLW